MLCLPPIPDDYDFTRPFKVYASVATLEKKQCEPAGRSYHYFCKLQVGLNEESKEDNSISSSSGSSIESDEDANERGTRERWEAENKENGSVNASEENLYEVLGLGHLGINASQQQIKKAYQKKSLLHHPDKKQSSMQSEESKEEIDAHWLLIQKAWETLGNPKTKLQYDSSFDFDDSIPSGMEEISSSEDFYDLYGPVFERNARFSRKKNVPFLGDDSTPLENVYKFYAFWHSFDSWREFVKEDEFNEVDLQNAESREEKRWMMRRNESTRKKLKKREYKRLEELVTRAFKLDPRLVRERQRQEREKEDKIREKELAKQEAERVAQEAIKKAEEAERLAKEKVVQERKDKQSAKKKLRKIRKLLQKLVGIAMTSMETDPTKKMALFEILNDICDTAVSDEQLKSYCDAFGTLNDENLSSAEGRKFAEAGLIFLETTPLRAD